MYPLWRLSSNYGGVYQIANLKKGEGVRSRHDREEMLKAVTNLRMYRQGEKVYYFVGVVGSGMRSRVQQSTHIKVIEDKWGESLETYPAPLETILSMMNTSLVRSG